MKRRQTPWWVWLITLLLVVFVVAEMRHEKRQEVKAKERLEFIYRCNLESARHPTEHIDCELLWAQIKAREKFIEQNQ